jgi:tetratricopeptide (TPR) repeat protein
MFIQLIFDTMNEMVEEIASHLPVSDESEEKRIAGQVKELKRLSDMILDGWIQLEEALDQKIKPHFPEAFPETLTTFPKSPVPLPEQEPMDENQSSFIKAKGYFDLGMYHESYPLFKEVIKKDPDHEIARLYFAYSGLFLDKGDEAKIHFSLIERTSPNPRIRAISLNALGIIKFRASVYDQAEHCFTQAIELDEELFVAYYNLALNNYTQGRYSQAISLWEQYLALSKEMDLELALYLSNCYLRLGQYQKAIDVWHHLSQEDENQILMQLGHFFEDIHHFAEAVQIYRQILFNQPNHAEALHGLAWNLWHLNQDPSAIPLLKKALSISRDNLGFIFSMAWIYFHLGKLQEAERLTAWMLKADHDYPLSYSMAFLIAMKKNDRIQAERWANRLREENDQSNRALGELFLGKLRLSQQNYEEAIRSFQISVWKNPSLRESALLQGLAHFLNGEPEKAENIWKKHQFSAT